jgi:hypothetical protein
MLDALEPYSKQMARDLFSVFPDWERYLSLVAEDGLNFFKVEVPSPNGDTHPSLGVTSLYNDEITVYFDSCHYHYASILTSENEPQGAISFIRQLINEELVVLSYICVGDNLIKDGVCGGSPVPVGEVPTANYEYYYASTMRVRSWKGTYNKEFSAPYVKTKPTQPPQP